MAWDEVTDNQRNGIIVLYELQYHQVAGSPTSSVNATDRLAFLTGLAAQTLYSIAIRAFTEDGGGPKSNALLVTTLSEPGLVPTGPPLNLNVIGTTVTSVSSTELNVTWNEVTSSTYEVMGYEVKYTQLDNIQEDRAQTNRIILPPSSSSVLLDGLRKYTRYNISVRVLTSEREGPFSSAVEAQTDEDGKSEIALLGSLSEIITKSW